MSIVTAACLFTILIQFSCILMASDRTLRIFICSDIKLRELHSVFPTDCTNFHPNRWCERILLYAHSQGNCVWGMYVCVCVYTNICHSYERGDMILHCGFHWSDLMIRNGSSFITCLCLWACKIIDFQVIFIFTKQPSTMRNDAITFLNLHVKYLRKTLFFLLSAFSHSNMKNYISSIA